MCSAASSLRLIFGGQSIPSSLKYSFIDTVTLQPSQHDARHFPHLHLKSA